MKRRRQTASRSLLLVLLAAVTVLLTTTPARSTLPQFTAITAGGHCADGSTTGPCVDKWSFTAFAVKWNLNPNRGGNISGGRTLEQVMQASFATWLAAPNTALTITEGPTSSLTAANASDGVNLICLVCSGDFSREAETLAVTFTTSADNVGQNDLHGGSAQFVGQLLDADILFNPSTQYSTDLTGGNGGSVQNLQTVATHEIGHFLGLDHSGVVRSVMFPFAPDLLLTLSYDDVAGVSLLYPKSAPDLATGTISGTVLLNGSSAVFGAHVFADSITSAEPFAAAGFANIRKSPISALTRPDGTYQIPGLPPDSYTVTAEPLDQPVTNSNVQFYPQAFNRTSVQVGFTTRWH